MEAYLDNSATTRVCESARAAALRAMETVYGNPSSGHGPGRAAKALLAESRQKVARALGCGADELVFTSGGTESDNWAVSAAAKRNRGVGKHIITTAVEHDAVLKMMQSLAAQGFEVQLLMPDESGAVSIDAFAAALRPDTALVSVMLVNNETGALFPVREVSRLIKARGSRALLHTDAVQGFLKIPFTPASLGADLLSLSAHKVHGMKGVGALYIKRGLHLAPLLLGGGQEGGLRSGTEPMPAIAAFGAAAEEGAALMPGLAERFTALRSYTVQRLAQEVPEAQLIGGGAGHILCLSLPGYRSEVLLNLLDSLGVYVSRGSACKRGARSHVLTAMGLPAPVIDGALRVSFSRESTEAEADAFVAALSQARDQLRHR